MTHLRLIHKLETRFQGNPVTRCGQPFLPNAKTQTNTAQTYFCVPWKNPRMQGLFGRAAITTARRPQGNAVDDYIEQLYGIATEIEHSDDIQLYIHLHGYDE